MVFFLLSSSGLEDSAKIERLWTHFLHCWGTTWKLSREFRFWKEHDSKPTTATRNILF